MAVREIFIGDQPQLREVSEFYTGPTQELTALLTDLRDTLEASTGIGLAAPQIGVPTRVMVVDVGEGAVEFVNPEVVEQSGEELEIESSLSLPGMCFEVPRPSRIVVQAKDRHGQPFELSASGLLARAICHGIDHLNGTLITDLVDEEDLLRQLMMNVMGDAQSDEGTWFDGDGQLIDEQNPMQNLALDPAFQDIQLAIDFISETSWKLRLAIELLCDKEVWQSRFGDKEAELNEMAEKLNRWYDEWSALLEEPDATGTMDD